MAISEETYSQLKADERYAKKYMDSFQLSQDPRDPLLNIVPLDEHEDFFGTKVCNIICFTGLYYELDTGSVAASLAKLAACVDKFSKYESHFIMDMSSSLKDEDDDKVDQMMGEISSVCNAPGLTFHGKLEGQELREKLQTIVKEFYAS